MTPAETALAFDAATMRTEREQKRDLWLAWHIVALGRIRKLPRLQRLLHPPETQPLDGEEKARRAQEFAELKQRMGTGRQTTDDRRRTGRRRG